MAEDTSVCQLHKKLEGIKLGWIKCANPALPDDPEGLCILHSKQKQKDDEGAFSTAVRKKLDLKDYNFQWVFFPTKADFKRHEFKEEADFIWATFSEEANFEYSIFHGGASFIGTAFLQKANFKGVTIAENKTVHFRVTDFSVGIPLSIFCKKHLSNGQNGCGLMVSGRDFGAALVSCSSPARRPSFSWPCATAWAAGAKCS